MTQLSLKFVSFNTLTLKTDEFLYARVRIDKQERRLVYNPKLFAKLKGTERRPAGIASLLIV